MTEVDPSGPCASARPADDAGVQEVEEPLRHRLAEILPLIKGGSANDAIAIAVAVEHSFGIVLTDNELDPEHLCDPDSLEATVRRHLAGR